MKRLTCEMCGSTDLMKDDGVFVCQSCGMKYSVEEAKKMMMVKNTVDVQGTVTLDENKTSRRKPLFVFLAILACILVLCIIVFVVMPLVQNDGSDDPVVALPSDVVESLLASGTPTMLPTATPIKIPAKTAAPTATPIKTPVKTAAPTTTPTKTPVKTAAPTATPAKTPVKTATPTSAPRPEQIVPYNLDVGDVVKFGFYEQDNILSNGQEEIKWIVLDKKDEKVLIISKYGLDFQPYHTARYTNVTWETCTLRSWLNTTFYTSAFNEKQQSMIISTTITNEDNPVHGTEGGNNTTDKVFLLSNSEAKQYFASNIARKMTATAYVKAQGIYEYDDGSVWWLRSPGHYRYTAVGIPCDGAVLDDGYGYNNFENHAVRPALWIDLDLIV